MKREADGDEWKSTESLRRCNVFAKVHHVDIDIAESAFCKMFWYGPKRTPEEMKDCGDLVLSLDEVRAKYPGLQLIEWNG